MDVDLVAAAAFLAAGAIATAGVVQLAGCFPWAARPAALRGAAGPVLVGLLALAVVVLAVTAVRMASMLLAWPFAVVAGGFGLILGPLLYQSLPARLKDSGGGLLAGSAVGLLASWLLYGYRGSL